jgi:hypothetical protein
MVGTLLLGVLGVALCNSRKISMYEMFYRDVMPIYSNGGERQGSPSRLVSFMCQILISLHRKKRDEHNHRVN